MTHAFKFPALLMASVLIVFWPISFVADSASQWLGV